MRLLCVETSSNHHETLLSFISYAQAQEISVFVAAPSNLQGLYESLREVEGFLALPSTPSALVTWAKAHHMDAIFHNTAYGRFALGIALEARGIPQFGIIHDTAKLSRLSYTGWRIAARMKVFFVLREKLRHNLPFFWRKKAYTLYLHSLPPSFWEQIPSIPKPPQQRWFAIPGRIERKRRAYDDLIEALAIHRPPPEWRFLLLGPAHASYSDWKTIKTQLLRYNLLEYFLYFPEGLSFPEYHAYLRLCEAILPLIHPGMPYFPKYLSYQITGGFSLAFIHRKPLLLHSAFAEEEDLRDASIFYSTPQELLSHLRDLPQSHLYSKPFWNDESKTLGEALRHLRR
ncbi:MAG: hypothetical protein NZZ60_06830 [Bacteroidia bacterium]|nr:hypothetical protein [Bacteroidia bacterium]MCX7651475.1 hypothetical protein [Bacteroidia bacterium]MDW8416770.1 hypothetical protein [Bacteroidia bacterium]